MFPWLGSKVVLYALTFSKSDLPFFFELKRSFDVLIHSPVHSISQTGADFETVFYSGFDGKKKNTAFSPTKLLNKPEYNE